MPKTARSNGDTDVKAPVSPNDIRSSIIRIPPPILSQIGNSEVIRVAYGSQPEPLERRIDNSRTYISAGAAEAFRAAGLARTTTNGREARSGTARWLEITPKGSYKILFKPDGKWTSIEARDDTSQPFTALNNESSPIPIHEDEDGVELTSDTDPDKPPMRPFDPTKVDIELKALTVDLLLMMIKEDEIDLSPSFQRAEVWNAKARSQLIESLLIRIPLPAFYMDGTNEDRWIVVDGLRRLSTLRDFAIEKIMALTELEFLSEYDGCTFDELPRNLRRRIEEAQVTVHIIRAGTPDNVKFNIFKRINTGGMPLSSQEIRHALNQGQAAEFLERLAKSDDFKNATDGGVPSKRMTDREFVLRFLAFHRTKEDPPRLDVELDYFLYEAMRELNLAPKRELQILEQDFSKAMKTAYALFKNDAFRKRHTIDDPRRRPLNKALFDAWSVRLAQLSPRDTKRLIQRNEVVRGLFVERLSTDREFEKSISRGTGETAKVQYRFIAVQEIIQKAIK
ncbi:MAG: DUF262 domain-containing protein [Myxococcota bacterium]